MGNTPYMAYTGTFWGLFVINRVRDSDLQRYLHTQIWVKCPPGGSVWLDLGYFELALRASESDKIAFSDFNVQSSLIWAGRDRKDYI